MKALTGTCGTVEFWSPDMRATETIAATASNNQATFPLTQLEPLEITVAIPDNPDTAWKGLVLMNGGEDNAQLTANAWSSEGTLVATKTITLGSHYRKAWLLGDLFGDANPGEITAVTVTSPAPVSGLSISGKTDGTMEATVGRN